MNAISVPIVLSCLTISLVCSGATNEYDNCHRLTKVRYNNGAQIIYSYDAAGNRLTRQVITNAFTIHGRVTLSDYTGDITQVLVTGELRQNGSTVRNQTLSLDAGGNYALPGVQPGGYDVAVKASHWLRKIVTGVQVVDQSVSNVNVSLTNGDADGDNEITSTDLSIIMGAMNAVPSDPAWDMSADLDGNSEITEADLSITFASMDQIGDP